MKSQRRGVMLAVALMIMGLVTALVSLLAIGAAQGYRERQADRVRIVAEQLADTAASYARLHAAELRSRPPENAITLDVTNLLPGHLEGSAILSVTKGNPDPVCHITARARWAAYEVVREQAVRLNTASQPSG